MFGKIGRLAERAANNVSVSRRGFLGRLGQGALAVGALLGAVVTPAAGQTGGVVCCTYKCRNSGYLKNSSRAFNVTTCQAAGSTCYPYYDGICPLIKQYTKSDCTKC
jgi:hypothetical protein